MTISADWNIDFTNKVISHIDGDLDYDTGAGTQPTVDAVIRGGTSGALGKILARSGTAASGTFTLTDVLGRFEDNEALTWCDYVDFDGVQNGGFSVGDTVTGATSGRTGVVRKIAYTGSPTSTSPGTGGRMWCEDFGTGAWTDDENIQVGGTTVAVADGTGGDNSAAWTSALVNEANGTPTAPSVSNILNFDTGTSAFVRFASVQDTANASPAKTGLVQEIYGATTTGSLRLVNVSGTWANNDPIYVKVLPFDNVQAGQSFKLNDRVVGGTSGESGVVIEVNTVASPNFIVLVNESGTFTDNEQLQVGGTYIADAKRDTVAEEYNQRALVNGSPITTQLGSQGGIYSDQLNVVRDCNAFYTYLQDTFDELGQLDDDVPMSAQVRLQQYTLVNGWTIPDLSYRFLESGSIQDLALDNIWTNYQTLGSIGGITDLAFAETTPQPQIYIEQNTNVLDTWWLASNIDVLVKVKSNTGDTNFGDAVSIDSSTGTNIDNGTVTIFVRRYGDTYDHFETTTIAGVAPIPLATATDLDNPTGTHTIATAGDETLYTVGEEIIDGSATPDPTKRGVVTATAAGDLEYILTGTTNFTGGETTIDGVTSGQSQAPSAGPTTVVAGYGTHIVFSTVQQTITSNGGTGTFIEGEQVTQAVSGATAILMNHSNPGGAGTLTLGNVNGTFDSSNTITGDTSSATATLSSPTIDTNVTTINRDIDDGNGNQPYNAVVYMDRTGASKQTLADMYEWVKYRTRRQETTGEPSYSLLGGKGDGTDGPTARAGRIYITLDDAYPLVKVSPIGSFAGGTFFGARGVFIQDMADADIRNYQLIDANGVVRNPPNLQTLTVNGLVSGDRVAVFRRPNSTPGSGIFTNEYSADGNQTSGSGTIVVTGSISSDTPDSGTVRIYNDVTLVYDSYAYTSFSGSTFTLSGTLSQTYTDGASPLGDVYVPLIQEQASGTSVSVNIKYSADIPLLARVRIRGILPFEVEGTFGSGGATITAIRTTDTIVS